MKSSSIKQSPCTQRGVDRCSLLFEVATDLFLRYGYEKVSLDQIVEHAGGSKATIYKYFGSKKGLFIAICQERCHKFTHQIELACQRDSIDIRENLSNLLVDLYSIFSDDKSTAFSRLVLITAQNDQDLAQQLYSFGPKRAHELLADLLQQAHESGQIYCTHPLDSAVYLLGFFHDIHWRTMVGLPISNMDASFRQYIHYVVDRFIEGHQKPEKV